METKTVRPLPGKKSIERHVEGFLVLFFIGYFARVVRQRQLYVISSRVGFRQEHEQRPVIEAEVDAAAVARG